MNKKIILVSSVNQNTIPKTYKIKSVSVWFEYSTEVMAVCDPAFWVFLIFEVGAVSLVAEP